MCITGFFFLSLYYFEWIGISGTKKTYELSLASGSGAIICVLSSLLFSSSINGIYSSLIFLISFMTMWLVARYLRTGIRFGNIGLLILTGSFITLSILLLNNLSINNSVSFFIKFFLLTIVSLIVFLNELYYRAKKTSQFNFIDIPTYKLIYNLINSKNNILDIGCSEGFFISEINAKFKVGIDINFHLLQSGKNNLPDQNFICADANNPPFANETFECVVLIGSLPYFEKPENVLSKINSILVPNGNLVLSAVTDHFFYKMINIYKYKNKINFFSKEYLINLLETSNYKINQITEKGTFFSPLLAYFYVITSFIDKKLLKSTSVVGPLGQKIRWLTNPLIDWEYNNLNTSGTNGLYRLRKKMKIVKYVISNIKMKNYSTKMNFLNYFVVQIVVLYFKKILN